MQIKKEVKSQKDCYKYDELLEISHEDNDLISL